MPTPDAAARHYLEQQTIAAGFVRRIRGIWGQLDPTALDESWRATRAGEQLYVIVSAGQTVMARQADPYIDAVLTEQRISTTSVGTVNARAFGGVASDGRSLETLLYEPVIATKVATRTRPPVAAFSVGESQLVQIVATQLADAGRTAVGTGMITRPAVTSWTRMTVPPSCSRCAVLAGKVFHYNAGFARHPHCQCRAIPTSEDVAGDITTSPSAYFDSLSEADQNRYFTNAGAQAIRDGADIGQVVNARRGMATAGQGFTTQGTTSRGIAGRRSPGDSRPLPETIYENAATRADALADLRRFAYVI